MCIFGLDSNKKEIATEDIKVLKVIIKRNGRLVSPIFSDELWEEGIEKTVDFEIREDKFDIKKDKYLTTTGIYSFDANCDPKLCLALFRFWGTSLELKLYEAVITKGSEYIRDGNQYCGNKLKLIKEYVF